MTKKTEIKDSLARVQEHILTLTKAGYAMTVAGEMQNKGVQTQAIQSMQFASSRIAKEIQVMEELLDTPLDSCQEGVCPL